jgi:hypothetical protein
MGSLPHTLRTLPEDYVLFKVRTEALEASERYAERCSKLSLTRLI